MAKQRLEEIRKIRLERAKKLRELGIDPYPAKVDGKPTEIGKARRQSSSAKATKGKEVEVVGRIMGWREHGNVIFADLKDESGQIQLWFQKNSLKDEFKILKYFDVGDFLYVQGDVVKTKAGELTIDVSKFQLLTKSIRPLPSSWSGFKDVEERYRQRYVDLLINKKVRENLVIRAKFVSLLRNYLEKNNFIEIETPILQPIYGGATAKPFITHHNSLDTDLYLRVADELYLKRLIAGGFHKVFEIGKDFRNEGLERGRNPEFTQLEFYWAYANYEELMKFTEEMLSSMVKELTGSYTLKFGKNKLDFKAPWKRVSYKELFKEKLGIDIDKMTNEKGLKAEVVELGLKVDLKKAVGYPSTLDAIYKQTIRSSIVGPIFLTDRPYEMVPLAKRKGDDKSKVAAFQLVAVGEEFLNAYNELNDPVDQKDRWEEDMGLGKKGAEEYQVLDEDYIRALEYGMPPTAGWGMGIDRFTMLLTGEENIKEVIAFPTLRPKGSGKSTAKIKTKKSSSRAKGSLANISTEVKNKFPGVSFAYTLIEEVDIKKKDKELEKLKGNILGKRKSISMEEVRQLNPVKVYRSMLKATGVNIGSRMPSPEALLKRIISGRGLYTINTAVDAYNLAVIETGIGLGGFDFEEIEIPVALRFSKKGEKMILLGESLSTTTKEGEIVYADKNRLLTLDLNYRDIDKTKITLNTKSIMLFADGGIGINPKDVVKALKLGADYIQKFCGGIVGEIVLVN